MTDELTGLRNRRWLFEALDDRVRRHEAYTRAWRAREADGAGEG
jgi:GGDEF domain-containing protein